MSTFFCVGIGTTFSTGAARMTSRTDVPSQDEYDPEEAAGDTDQEEEHMECESYADNKEIKTIVPGVAAAGPTEAAAATADSIPEDISEGITGSKHPIGPGQPIEGPVPKGPELGGGEGQSSKGPPTPPSVGEKAKAYLKKKKDDRIREIKATLGEKLLAYEAVNAANRRRLTAAYLQTGEGALDEFPSEDDDFLSTGDGRAARMFVSCNVPLKQNVSYSFDPVRKACTFCPAARDHQVLGTPLGNPTHAPGREVLILCDQSFPPLLPSSTDKKCLRIIRLEFGSIMDLVGILLDLLRGRSLTNGSIIMMFSASHLANVGLAGYIEDLVSARRKLAAALGRGIYFAAAPPMLLGGTRNTDLISNISALTAWVNLAAEEDSRFSATSDIALQIMLENGSNGGQRYSCTRVRLPASLDNLDKKTVWAVGGDGSIPNEMGATSMEQEGRIINSLIGELQLNFALDLDNTPLSSRTIGSKGEVGAASFLVVGSSNARRLEEALKAKGIPTGSILANGWRATKKSAEDMAAHVRAELAERYYSAVVFQLLDNNIFFSKFEDGSLCPSRRTSDGNYHVEGELVVASRESQFAILKMCTPLWEAAKGRHMVVVGPMPRYVTEGCCPDPDHVTNRTRPDFYTKMKDDLVSCGTAIKDFLFTSGLRNGRVMDPGRQLRGLDATEIWGTDRVHPKREVYGLLANGVINVERACGSGRSKTRSVSGGEVPTAAHAGGSGANLSTGNRTRGQRSGNIGDNYAWREGGRAPGGGKYTWKSGGPSNWRGPHRGGRAGRSGRGRWGRPY